MNHRVLELLKAPKNIQSEDLNLLKEEINSFPYVQNIRALYLYGVNLYDKENYQKVLSTTAAYTTDKKILYQLINGKIQPKPEVTVKPDYTENPLKKLYQSKVTGFPIKKENESTDEMETGAAHHDQKTLRQEEERILPAPQPEIKHLYINGQRNRILFEGEENYLENDEADTIDLESTLESGSIVIQRADKKEHNIHVVDKNTEKERIPAEIANQAITEKIKDFVSEADQQQENVSENPTETDKFENIGTAENSEEFTPETIIEGENTDTATEEGKISDESEVSFHEIEPFVSEDHVHKIEKNKEQEIAESKRINETDNSEKFTPETIIEEQYIDEDKGNKILDESEVSFHEVESVGSEIQKDGADENIEETSEDVAETENTSVFTSEKIINEDRITSEKEQESVKDESELSFHGTESFLPEITIQPNTYDEIKSEAAALNINKHEDEMRRLIEEVEKKMKEKAASAESEKIAEPETASHDISFAETQNFTVKSAEEPDSEEKNQDFKGSSAESTDKEVIANTIHQDKVQPSWKPMSFEPYVPDSLINKSPEVPQPKNEKKIAKVEETQNEGISVTEETLPPIGIIPVLPEDESDVFENQSDKMQIDSESPAIEEGAEEKEEAPVMNVSFFGSDISKLRSEESQKQAEKAEKRKEEKPETVIPQKMSINPIDSNIPGFINTWQSWLKIDRTEDVEKEKSEIKTKAIETFIENNPRISQLKDESTYVIKEKNDDISHLMTETLASLYFEQKLYTKAIKAFEILIKKNPEKKKYYEGKIQEIKDFRSR